MVAAAGNRTRAGRGPRAVIPRLDAGHRPTLVRQRRSERPAPGSGPYRQPRRGSRQLALPYGPSRARPPAPPRPRQRPRHGESGAGHASPGRRSGGHQAGGHTGHARRPGTCGQAGSSRHKTQHFNQDHRAPPTSTCCATPGRCSTRTRPTQPSSGSSAHMPTPVPLSHARQRRLGSLPASGHPCPGSRQRLGRQSSRRH